MTSFTLITTGKIVWGTVHAKDISVTFSASTKGGTIVRDNILTDAASVLWDGQGRTINHNFSNPKTVNINIKNQSQSEVICPKTLELNYIEIKH